MSEVMDRLKAALADRYAIEREIGAGGMATVYLARDLRHDRKVAVKVLRSELAAVLGPERFLAEIQVTANLQHPHLLPLFDSGEADGQLYYVMPFVEGESLRARLDRERQLPVDEALRIGVAVAEALDFAHRRGVIHRDLKPENILLQDGQPLVADFGIALAVSNAGGARVTQTGLSLGTPAYMSPEQATGDRQVDGRSDVYSLAAVTYEMLVGDPPHVASTAQALIAKVLTEKPVSVRAQRESVPEHVDAALGRALSKLPADRFPTASEFKHSLTDSSLRRLSIAGESVNRPWKAIALSTSGLAGILATILLWPKSAPANPSSLLELTFSDSSNVGAYSPNRAMDISPDGSKVVYRSRTLMIRDMRDMRGRPITTGGGNPIEPHFSPDGNWVFYYQPGGAIEKVPVQGGPAITVADSVDAYGFSWGDDNRLLFTRGGSLYRVSAGGGDPTLVAAPDAARGHLFYRWPQILPGARFALVTFWKGGDALENAQLAVVDIEKGEVAELGVLGTSPQFSPTGHVIFARADAVLAAVPFSLRTKRTTGEVTPLGVEVRLLEGGAAEFGLSRNGTLLFRTPTNQDTRLVAVDRAGAARPLAAEVRPYDFPRISPDGKKIAVSTGPLGIAAPGDIWIYDVGTETNRRLTSDGRNWKPEWSADGSRVAYLTRASDGSYRNVVRWQAADGTGVSEVLLEDAASIDEVSIGPPHSFIVIRRGQSGGERDLLVVAMDSLATRRPLVATPAQEFQPRLSPDGRILAYTSTESGRVEVYVRPMAGSTPIQVSRGGGQEPVWSQDGEELFFKDASLNLVAATIRRSPELLVSHRDTLFSTADFLRGLNGRAAYDVFPSGQEFVMVQRVPRALPRVLVIQNWFEEVARATSASSTR